MHPGATDVCLKGAPWRFLVIQRVRFIFSATELLVSLRSDSVYFILFLAFFLLSSSYQPPNKTEC